MVDARGRAACYWFILATLLKQFGRKNSGILHAPDNADARE